MYVEYTECYGVARHKNSYYHAATVYNGGNGWDEIDVLHWFYKYISYHLLQWSNSQTKCIFSFLLGFCINPIKDPFRYDVDYCNIIPKYHHFIATAGENADEEDTDDRWLLCSALQFADAWYDETDRHHAKTGTGKKGWARSVAGWV